jgi:hypothetical protein
VAFAEEIFVNFVLLHAIQWGPPLLILAIAVMLGAGSLAVAWIRKGTRLPMMLLGPLFSTLVIGLHFVWLAVLDHIDVRGDDYFQLGAIGAAVVVILALTIGAGWIAFVARLPRRAALSA